MTYVAAKAAGAIDWFNGSPLHSPHGSKYQIHSHHIFPVSLLYSDIGGYSGDNFVHRKLVNEIANRAFLTGTSNISLSNALPEEYLPKVEEKYPGALAKQFVPTNPELWKLDRYEDFLAERRRLIAEAINTHLSDLQGEPQKAEIGKPAHELISMGESAVIEFKSSLRWDVMTQQVNKGLQWVVAKTVAGFCNAEGGTVLIGVADDRVVLGIDNDMKSLSKPDVDGFELALRTALSIALGDEYGYLVAVGFEEVEGKTVAVIHVEKSPKPCYLSGNGSKEFYVRVGNATKPLDLEAAHDYIKMHWES